MDKMEMNKSIDRSTPQRNLYNVLVEAYKADKDILETYGDIVAFKRRQDDHDKDEEPSAGSNRGSKKRRAGKEPESTSAPKERTTKTTGKSADGSKSHHKSAGQSAQAEEPMHIFEDLEEPTHQELPSPDRDWNKTLPTDHRPVQPWLSNLAQKKDPRKLYPTPELLSPKLLSRPTFELMKGTCKSLGISHWGRKRQQFFGFAANMEYAQDVYYRRRIISVTKLQIVEWHGYKHLDWITVCRDDDKLYTFKEGDFKRLRLQDIEDMLILLVQGKLTNLNVEEHLAFSVSLSDLKRREAYSAYSNPRGFIYQNKDKKNKLIRIDELYKFSDVILNDVRTALDDRLKGIRMEYLPQTI
ncbi:hypothetical protein Tco_1273018 [Tanacetum coccineum]